MTTYRLGIEALADPTRRAILESLGAAPQSVRQLADLLPVSRPAVSQHLRVLLDAGLVTAAAVGTRRIYAVDLDGIGAVRSYFDQFWAGALTDFAVAAETSYKTRGKP